MKLLPSYTNCFICGTKNEHGLKADFYKKDEEDVVFTKTKITEKFAGYKGLAHGGVICALLDEVMGRIVANTIRKLVVTAEITIRYHSPIPSDLEVTVEGKMPEDQPNRRIWLSEGKIFDNSGKIYASGKGKFIAIPDKKNNEILETLNIGDQKGKVTMEDI